MTDQNEVEIGYICFKGPHVAFRGESDYGCCGSKAFAKVYIRVEVEHRNPRGEEYTAQDVADSLARHIAEAEAHGWCDTDADD
jgi:hypothetical protein